MTPKPNQSLALVVALLAASVTHAQSTDVLLNCSTCHVAAPDPEAPGTGGREIYPNLNGQPARYIERQLMAYRLGLRAHRQMEQTALALGEGAGAMARLYAGAPHPDLVFQDAREDHQTALGLVEDGDWSRGLPPCASCHALAPGNDRARLSPRLHGQPEAYLDDQLRAYADGTRASDPMGRMRAYSERLTPSEISALARYFARWTPDQDTAEGPSE